MNKPDWKDAPEWANWLAMESDGAWHWWSEKPFISIKYDFWISNDEGRFDAAVVSNWENTLEQRPINEETK